MRKNSHVAAILYEIADLLEIQDVQWKPQAYRKAAQTIESLPEDIAEVAHQGLKKLEELPGVGKNIAEKIEELVKKGKLGYLEKLKKQIPIDVGQLMQIEGLGHKTIKRLYKQLKIKTIVDLKRAAQEGKIRKLEGLGEKKEQQILESIKRLEKRGPERFLLGHVAPLADEIVQTLKRVPGVQDAIVAGSFRRGKETVGDLDILITSTQPKTVMEKFITLKGVDKVLAHGDTKSSIRLENGLQIDARVVEKNQYGSALQYFTGSKEHSIALRKIALKKGLTLSEYGLFKIRGKTNSKKLLVSKTEEEVYAKLGMQCPPPEMRENLGEIELAQKHKLPKLVEWKDLHGDFQTQTNWSDGAHSMEEMARKAQELGWKFMVITDHVGGIGIVHPLDEKRLAKQGAEIDKLNNKFEQNKLDFHLFKGAEVDIKANGELALSKEACKKLDVVLASIHSSFRMVNGEMTQRICNAIENYPVHVLAHPTARNIPERDPIDFDLEKVFQTAKDQSVYLEINGQPKRMDLKDSHVQLARELGCEFVISSDAHSKDQLTYLRYGLLTARRGWLQKSDILNTHTVAQTEKQLQR